MSKRKSVNNKSTESETQKNTISTTQLKSDMLKRFAVENKPISNEKLIQKLYKKYQKQLTFPALTPNNVVKVMRYVKKYNVNENKVGKVIKKVTKNTQPVIGKTQFAAMIRKIETEAMPKKNKYGYNMSRKDVLAVSGYVPHEIRKYLEEGKNVRIAGIGRFDCAWQKGRKFHNRFTGKDVPHKGHYTPKLRVAADLRRDVKNANK